MKGVRETGSSVSEPETAGAAKSFESFFRDEHVRLLRAMYLVTGNRDEAEDLMQEAFLRVWQKWDRVRDLDDPTGYLFRTAMNAFRSRLRRAARVARRLAGGERARDELADAEGRDMVARALGRLTPRQRAALVLTEMLGYGSEEAGRILGVKPVTVRVLASQGREALRTIVEKDDE